LQNSPGNRFLLIIVLPRQAHLNMKQIETYHWRFLQCCFMLIFFLMVLPGLSGCKKLLGIEELVLTGTVTDDITGAAISGSGSIRVDGYNGNAAGLLAVDRKSNIGTGKINADGSFKVTFSKWDPATTYEFYFGYPSNAYINNGNIYLNTLLLSSTLFSNGSYNTTITAAKLTELQINFQNQNPVNADDSLHISFPDNNVHFYYLFPKWENLQNCSAGPWGGIKGGVNARGTLKCNVPCDRKFKLKWLTRKNGIINNYNDSVFCPRNITTIYSLNY
jgi:hypothetical protein